MLHRLSTHFSTHSTRNPTFIKGLPVILSLVTAIFITPAYAEEAASAPAAVELTAREVMETANEVELGNRVSQKITMTMYDAKNNIRGKQELHMFRMYMGEDRDIVSLIFVTAPYDRKDIGFLSIDYIDHEKIDDQWVHLPSINKTKKVAANDKSMAFMNSDFSYADLALLRNTNNYEYRILRKGRKKGQPVWLIEGKPLTEKELKETGYAKTITVVRQEDFLVIGSINRLQKGSRQKNMEVTDVQLIDGITTPSRLVMTTEKGGAILSKTVFEVSDIQYNHPNVTESLFTVEQLQRGLPEGF
jgi:hypothetical protein